MNLAIFDIDGTLAATNRVDGECFVRAVEMTFGVTSVDEEWRLGERGLGKWYEYPHITDAGIAREVFQRAFARWPEAEEIQRLADRYIGLLQASYASEPRRFREIAGAGDLLRRLSGLPDWRVAVATGGWRALATYKLQCARIPVEGLPFSTSDEGISREEIVTDCVARARAHYGIDRFARIVSIGDGAWDVKTARALGLPFIGVGEEARLTGWGALHVVQDYRDPVAFIRLLEEAQIPNY
jgi:phosphoglycolate phosphatase-like HAD superfamily hydrolase